MLEALGTLKNFTLNGNLSVDLLSETVLKSITVDDQFICRLALSLITQIGFSKLKPSTLMKIKTQLTNLILGKTLELALMGEVVSCYELLFKFTDETLINELMKEFTKDRDLDVNQVSLVLSS